MSEGVVPGAAARSRRLIGIDGCKDGWVAVSSEGPRSTLTFERTTDLAPIFAEAEHGEALVIIDIPIGLPDDARPRACDIEARKLLGSPRASSVFPAPCRAALAATTYAEACDLSVAVTAKRLSQQAFAILDRIRSVDLLITPERQSSVREGHPEVTFAVLSERRRGLDHAKRTADGRAERLDLLRRHVPPFDPERERARLGRGLVGTDDVIDAVACLVTAFRLASGVAHVIPRGIVQRDARGLRMEMVA